MESVVLALGRPSNMARCRHVLALMAAGSTRPLRVPKGAASCGETSSQDLGLRTTSQLRAGQDGFTPLWMFPFDIAIAISFLPNPSLQTDFVKDINFCNLGGKVQRDGGRPSGTFEVA